MNYRIALLQIILLIIVWFVENLGNKVFHGNHKHRHKHSPIVWTILLWGLSIYNIASLYWIAYPVAIWMVIAIALIIGQTMHYNEFIYRRYWPVFWRLSVIVAIATFVFSLFSQNLPII